MHKIIITTIRDMLNLVFYSSILISLTMYIYKFNAELESLKNVLFPMKLAIITCVGISIFLVFINRGSTLIAIKIDNKVK